MAKKVVKTTVRGERKIAERAGRASVALGLLTLTFMNSQVGVFGMTKHTMAAAMGAGVLALALTSRLNGQRTGGTAGIILGLLVFYFTFLADHVTKVANQFKYGKYALTPYLLVIGAAVCLWYVLHRPRRVIEETKTDS